jgi:GAF domain-containing protein
VRILIVDDDELLAYLVAEQLHRQEGTFQAKPVMTADAARAAVRSAADPFDVFLIDQLLAGSDVDGVALMQELTQLNGSGDTILFTGQDDPATAYKAMEQGAYRYLFKPFDTRDLVLTLKSLAAFQQTRRERNWLEILAKTSIELQKRSAVAEIADVTAQCALLLGFERIWFWRVVEEASGTPILRGIWQIGYPTAMQPEEVEIPVQGAPDDPKRLGAKGPEIDDGRQWGAEELAGRFPGLPSQGKVLNLLLVAGNTLLGVLSLDPVERSHSFNLERRNLLRIFAAQISAALARAFQQEKEAKEDRERRMLWEIGQRILERATSGNLDNLLSELHGQAARLMDTSNFAVALVEAETDLLDFRFHCAQNEKLPRKWYLRSSGLIGHLIEKNEPFWFPNGAEADYRLRNHIPLWGEMSQCWLGVPLRVEGRGVIGAVVVQDYQNPSLYTRRHQQKLMELAEQIAGAIELANQREREEARRRRGEFLDALKGYLPAVIQENEDWFWHLILKFVTDTMGLRFNRALVFLCEEGDPPCLRGRLGVGHLELLQARYAWDTLAKEALPAKESVKEFVKEFVQYLRLRREEERTPLEQKVAGWQLAGGWGCWQKTVDGPVCVAAAELVGHLAEPYFEGFTDLETAVCVVAPILAGDDRKGILIADNAFTDEPVRRDVLEELGNLLVEAGRLWKNWRQTQHELNPSERNWLAGLRRQVLSQLQNGDDLKKVLEQICSQARLLLGAASVVIYPMDKGSISYMTEKIASAGLESPAVGAVVARPRQSGINAHIRRVGRVLIPDVRSSPLVFDDVPLQQRGFIQRHNVRAFIGRSLQAHATNDPLGVLFVNYATVHPFDRHHEELVEQLAEIACLSIEDAHGSALLEDRHRTQELNRLRYILEAALTPDADDNKAIGALLANTQSLLPAADCVELMVKKEHSGRSVLDGRWRTYRHLAGKPPEKRESSSLENPVAQYVLLHKGSLLASNFAEVEGAAQPAQVASVVASQVYHNKVVVGVLLASAARPNVFSERDHKRIEELAAAAGMVIGNLHRRQGLLRGVLDAAEKVTRPTSLEETLQSVVEHSFVAAPDLDCVTIWYHQPGSAGLVAGPQSGLQSGPALGRDNPMEQALVDQIAQQPEAVWVPDIQRNAIFGQSSFLNDEQIVSVAAFPLRVDGVVGALFFYYRTHHEFTQEEKDVFPIFAAISAAAIQQKRLLELSERRKRRLEDALKVTRAVQAHWALSEVLPAILKALRDHFSPYMPGVAPCWLTYNAQEDLLELPEEVRCFYQAMAGAAEFVPLRLDAPHRVSQVARDCIRLERTVVNNTGSLHDEVGALPSESLAGSELCAGLWRNQSLLGVLVFKSPKRDAFSQEDQEWFELVAEQSAVAIERANQVARKRVDDFLTGATAWASEVAHDINVDISYIRNRAYWLRERMPEVTAQGRQWAKEIDERAGGLANKARYERAERARETLRLAAFLEHKVQEWQVRACPATKITYEWGDTPLWVAVYREQLWRAVRHLLRNAVEAMDYRGEIWLRLRSLPLNRVELLVENSGPDLSPLARQKLFREPYSSRANEHERGMGLLIARVLIEQMGGTIRLLPARPGRGPVFSLWLPCSQEEGATA